MEIAFIFALVFFLSQATGNQSKRSVLKSKTEETITRRDCTLVENYCLQNNALLAKCFEDEIANCNFRRRGSGIVYRYVNASHEAVESLGSEYQVHLPSSALQRSRGDALDEEVRLIITALNSTRFKVRPNRGRSRMFQPQQSPETVLNGNVLFVRAGRRPVQNLPQPIRLTFHHNKKVQNGTCVFWTETSEGEGYWSTSGCNTHETGSQFICSCNHLSFFAVLVNPVISVSKKDAVNLTYITCVGSSLSVIFSIATLIIFACQQKRRPEKAIGIHMNLSVSLLFLHMSFLLSSFYVWHDEDGWLCRAFGLILHWSMMATITWSAVEGFHLYLLLVRVFNIYIRRYLLKLSLVGWGFSTLIAASCGFAGVYGKQIVTYSDSNNLSSSTKMCMMDSQFPPSALVIYVTAVVYPSLVVLCNSCMLGVVVYKMFGHKRSVNPWKEGSKENWRRLLKSCATVLGLSCVVGLPWGLTSVTYISTPGIYFFTVLNSLQGVFVFVWCLAMICKASTEDSSTVKGSSSMKMTTITSNN